MTPFEPLLYLSWSRNNPQLEAGQMAKKKKAAKKVAKKTAKKKKK